MVTRRQSNRARIIDGAAYLLESGSLDAFTVDSLSRYLKMSRSTLYRYFPSKEMVMDTLVSEVCEGVERELSQLGYDADAAADAEMSRFVDVVARYADAVPRALAVQQNKLPASTQARLVVTRVSIKSACARILRVARAAGLAPVRDAELIAGGIVSAFDAVIQSTARREDIPSRSEPIREIAQVMLFGVFQDGHRLRSVRSG